MGLRDRSRVPGGARLDRRLRRATRSSRSTSRSPRPATTRTTRSARRSSARCRSRSRTRACGPATSGPTSAGPGYGQVKLALMNEILGRSNWAPIVFGCQAPDSGNAEILAHYGTREQKERYLEPLLDSDDRLLLLDDRAAGRRRPEGVHVRAPSSTATSGSSTARSGSRRTPTLAVVPHRDGGDRPRRARAPAHVDVPGAHAHAGAHVPPHGRARR